MLVVNLGFELSGGLLQCISFRSLLVTDGIKFFEFGFEDLGLIDSTEIDVEFCGTFVACLGAEEEYERNVDTEEDGRELVGPLPPKTLNEVARDNTGRQDTDRET